MELQANGGFPEPLSTEPVRVVRCRHASCGAETRVRVPRVLSADAVRRVVCDSCHQRFACEAVDEGVVGLEAPPARVRGWLSDPDSPAWRYLSIPVAAAVVIAVLALIQGC